MKTIDQLRKSADDACERLGTAPEMVQVIVARSYGPRSLDAQVPPMYTIMVEGVGPKTLTFSACDLEDALGSAVGRLEGTG